MPSPLNDFVMWLLGGAASALAAIGLPIGKAVKDNHKRSKRNERQLQGDPDDPNAEGVLDIAHETREKVDHLETRMEHEHRETMAKLDKIADGDFEADA